MFMGTIDADLNVSAFAILFTAVVGLSFWIAFGFPRWGVRISTALVAFSLVWLGVLRLVSDPQTDDRITGVYRTSVTLELLLIAAFCVFGYFFYSWLDNRLIDQYSDEHPIQLTNAEFNIQDLLLTTVAIALVMTLANQHQFYVPDWGSIWYTAFRASTNSLVSIAILWAILSMATIPFRLVLCAGAATAAYWLSSQISDPPSGVYSLSAPALTLRIAIGVSFISLILNLCGFRLVIPPASEFETARVELENKSHALESENA